MAYQRVLAATTGLDVAARWLARLDEMGKPSSTIVFRSPYEAQLRVSFLLSSIFPWCLNHFASAQCLVYKLIVV